MSTAADPGSPRGSHAFCTIIAKNYLAHARALHRSLRTQHPEALLYVLLVDEVEERFEPTAEEFILVPLRALDPPARLELCFRYELLELCTAVKPLFLRWLFAEGHSKLVFLDPDVWVYRPLDEVLGWLDRWDVILTPHLTARVDDGGFPDERLMLLVGAYNLGFLALARSAAVDGLLDWWWAHCERDCLLEMQRGLFLDQKWMNLVPGMLDRVLVLRHPGYNLAHWNLNHRALTGPPAGPLVNGQPLYFLHGSSVDPLDPSRLACPQTRYEWLDGEPLLGMLRSYSAELLAAGYQSCRSWPYSYRQFRDGHPIHPEMRRLFREQPAGRFPDPFQTEGDDTFPSWAAAPRHARSLPAREPAGAADPPIPAPSSPAAGDGWRVMPLLRDLYRSRRDLHHRRRTVGSRGEGVTVVGYLRAESGMGELARSTVRALRQVSYPLNTLDLHDRVHRHSDLSVVRGGEVSSPPGASAGTRLPITIAVLTAPEARRERATIGLPHPYSYAIGYWPWELEVFPDDLPEVFAGFDEVWALSSFSAAAIAAASPVPVHTVWPALPDVEPGPPGPGEAALDPDEFNFLFVYDLLSETERKNPEGLLRAFRDAFHREEPVRLTIKTINGEMRSDELRRVVRAAEGLRASVHDRYLSRADLLHLVASCDCYVSLHRAEGFGFTLAEAMALGKPMIATFYSGNTDYMTPWSCLPVPYRMTEVGMARGAYRPGDAWAEPDLEAAADLMRKVYREPEEARAVGSRGQRHVRELLSLTASGRRMAARLRRIG